MESFLEVQQNQLWLVLLDRLTEDDVGRLGAEIQMWCDSAAKMGIRELHLDLAAVTMVSSGSLRLLLTMARRLQRDQMVLVLTSLSPGVADSLTTSGFLKVFEAHGRIASTPRVAPTFPSRGGLEEPQLDLGMGSDVFVVSDGDALGSAGKFAPQLLQLRGIAEKHAVFHLGEGQWWVAVTESAGTKTQLDAISLSPGQIAPLRGAHTLQLASLRVYLQVTPPRWSRLVRRYFSRIGRHRNQSH